MQLNGDKQQVVHARNMNDDQTCGQAAVHIRREVAKSRLWMRNDTTRVFF
jgi:hypothetical protein